jgi:hypothetical protein
LALYLDRLTQLRFPRSSKRPQTAVPRNHFLYAAAILVPIWAAYSLENYSPGAARSSFGILLLALSLPFWLLGRWVEGRERAYRMPLYLVGYGTAVIGTFLVIENQPLLIGALLFDAFLGLLSARFFKRSSWLYVAVVTLPIAWLLTLDEGGVAGDRFGWGLLGLSQLFIIVAWWLSRPGSAEKFRQVSSFGMPFLIGAFWLISLSVPLTTQNRLGIQVGYVGAAFLLTQTAVWLRQPILSAVAAGLLTIPYWLTVTDIGIERVDYGLAWWPFIIVYLLLGYGLDKFVGLKQPASTSPGDDALGVLKPFPWYSPGRWFEVAIGRALHWWALAFYGLAFSLAGLTVLLSSGDSDRSTIALLLTAVIFGWASSRTAGTFPARPGR